MFVSITDEWNRYLAGFPSDKKDVYFEEGYVKLYNDAESEACCIVCKDEEKILLMPFLKRKIEGYKVVEGLDYYDFETPYGYGGPIANNDDETWIKAALDSMNQYFKEQNYVCGFLRFHPLLRNDRYCGEAMKVFYDRQTIAIDTSQSEDEIWKTQITSKNRNMIRKAEKNGCEFKAEYEFESLPEFIDLYNSTMKRLEADDFYFFDDDYYQSFVDSLNGNSFLGTIRKDGKLICGALFMYSDAYGHYHLEGSDRNYSNLGANNMLLWKTAIEMKKHNICQFHLGGGYSSEQENSLFKFKKAFSSNVKEFFIGKDIFNISAYDAICNEWKARNVDMVKTYENRLLCYRYRGSS